MRRTLKVWCAIWLAAVVVGLPMPALAKSRPAAPASNGFDIAVLNNLKWRFIGPANMGGRTADVEGIPGDPNIVYAATASGGLFKTTNGGNTWEPIFERQGTISIGDIAIDPRNHDVIWVGTGESNTRNSVSFGDGVYRSLDGGKTWQHMGLRDTERISRIVIHPHDSNIVYVGALGHAFGPNTERGVYMTTDGGKSWQKTLYIDDKHGVSDLDIDPANPNIVYAGMWHFERKPWTFTSGSENGGIFRSTDGGRTWTKLTHNLPKLMGRIGIKVAPSKSNIVYAMVESKEGLLYRSDDRGETWREMSRDPRIVGRGFYYTDLRVDPQNEERVYAIATFLSVSIDGGRTFRTIAQNTHVDYHALWIDPLNPNRMWQGQDGGIAVSNDRGETWEYVNNFPAGQFYQIHADNREPFYYVMGGLQDNGSWTGPSRTREPAGILNDDWRMVGFGDGFYALNHPDDPELYISESQGGNIVLTDFRNREQQLVAPMLGRGGPAKNVKYRFNWNSPIVLSKHDKNTLYFGGNVVFKSTDFGRTWTRISDDLTTNDPEKQKDAGGPIATENSTAEYHCTIISLAESPLRAGVIWAGTDDGNLQVTTDGGKTWTNLIKNVPGMPPNSPVSHVEPSGKDLNTVYVSFDRHMFDDFRPYVFKSTDGGKTWTNVSAGLPEKAYVQCLREDPKNPNLIYAGTELGLFASYTGGGNWVSLGLNNLPNVAVHDIIVHPRENDLILATHGRSIVILDDATPVQQMNAQIAASDAHLFDIRPAIRHTMRFTRYGIGDRVFKGENPPYGALISYYLKEKPDEKTTVMLQILDSSGKVIREVKNIPKEKGLNRTAWDLRHEGARSPRPVSEIEMMFGGGPRGPQVLPGTYTVKLVIGDKTYEKPVVIRLDPTVKTSEADLRTLHEMSLRLRDMQSTANDAIRTMDGLREQITQVEKTVKDRMPDAPEEVKKALEDHRKQVEEIANKIAPPARGGMSWGGARIGQMIGQLLNTIVGVNAAPTPTQREAFNELQPALRERVDEVNRYLREQLPKLNEILRRHNAPTIIGSKPIEMPR